jgi:RNA polymerase sigma factor (sigma-70 family)
VTGFSDCQPDPAIIERARRGDMKAHEVLYASYGRPVYTLAARMLGDRSLAEEVLQDTCIEVIRHLAGFREAAAFGGWVKRIATNKCLAHLRSAWHRKSRSFAPAGDDEPVELPAGGDDPAARVARGTDLVRALDELSPTARAVVWLYDVEGYSHQEIAGLMGKTVSFSKSQLSRAHERLREMLGTDESEEVTACTPRPNSF